MKLNLIRLEQMNALPQRGVIIADGTPRWTTLERPWLDNERNVSCIPEGSYVCKKTTNRQLTSGTVMLTTFEIMDVPNRQGILFHMGNKVIDTEGCILLGEGFSLFKQEHWIVNSRLAFRDFILYTEGIDEFILNISKLKLP